MKNKTVLAMIIVFVPFLFCNSVNCKSEVADLKNLNLEELENYLRTAQIVAVDIDPEGGRTEPWRITLDDGKTVRRGFFKHINNSRPTFLPDSYKYEIAAYELNKLLDTNIVPPVVEREVNDIKGSLQIFVENCISLAQQRKKNIHPSDPVKFQNYMDVISIFENLTFCERKETDDILIHTEDWRVCRVDFSEAFEPVFRFLPDQKIQRCSKKLYNNLLKLNRDALETELKPYLNTDEIDAILERKKIILKKIEQLIKEKGEESVLF